MADAVGFSRLYPAVPIMNFVSMTLLLLLIPGFWKTRMVALVSVIFWVAIANLVSFVGMARWRGNTNDVPIWAVILAILDRIWTVGFFMAMTCLAHFTCQPLSVRQLYDTVSLICIFWIVKLNSPQRRRNNLIHFFLTLILPLLWAPLIIFSWHSLNIIEDLGPVISLRFDWPAFVINQLPQIICLLAIVILKSLAVFTYWRMKRENPESDPLKQHYSVRTRKLIIMAHLDILWVVYGLYRQVWYVYPNIQGWVTPTSLAENIASLQLVLERTRPSLETESPDYLKAIIGSRILIPLIGFYLFAWFGFEAEIRKAYWEALSRLGRLISAAFREHRSHLCPLPSSRWLIGLRKATPQHDSTDSLSLIDLNIPQITPYISSVARGDEPGSHENFAPSNSVGNAIDVKRQARERAREPARRLSSHKPFIAPLNPANATMNITNSVPLRRLSHQKPPMPPVNPTASVPEAHGSVPLRVDEASNTGRPGIPSTPPPCALRRSYHKPSFVPLGLPTDPAMTSPNASGSVGPRVEGMDSARRQDDFALRGPHRRISYHKPTFVPSGRPNASAIATLEGSGNTPPRTEGVNNARRHEKFAPQAPPRRISYHKPAFVPLAPLANDTGEAAYGSGPSIDLAEAPRDLISDRNARLQAERAPPPFSRPSTSTAPPSFPVPFDSVSPPPAFLSSPTSTAPPASLSDVSTPLSTPSTKTPAPPYRDVNPFFDRAT